MKNKKLRRLMNCAWYKMIKRCTDPEDPDYKNYGARGITVCDRWMIFSNFLEDMGERPRNTSLDRIDNNKGYYKENCHWATREQQAMNRRVTIWIDYMGEKRNVKEVSAMIGVKTCQIYERIKNHGINSPIVTMSTEEVKALGRKRAWDKRRAKRNQL